MPRTVPDGTGAAFVYLPGTPGAPQSCPYSQENSIFCKNPLTNSPLFGYNTMVIADVCIYARRMDGSRNTGR